VGTRDLRTRWKKKKKNPGINPGQPAATFGHDGKKKKKTLVLTLGNPPEMDREKKNKKPWY
jgi:hypothetical protein